MPKRKRSTADEAADRFADSRKALFRILKTAKGFERQRLAKRARDKGVTADKLARLEREVAVLKSLDLHQAAHSHLCSSLLRVKGLAASAHLPEEARAGVPRPELEEDERAALHNVTSALYNRPHVRAVVEKAVADMCGVLGVEAPGKKAGKGVKKEAGVGEKGKTKEESKVSARGQRELSISDAENDEGESDYDLEELEKGSSDEDDFNGFSADDGDTESGDEEAEDLDTDAEEAAIAKFDSRLASPSDDESEDEAGAMDISGSEGVSDDDISGSESSGTAPPPAKKAASKTKKVKTPARPSDSTFLPSLMGGYISGSESASDVDVAPPRKNRRGQRARQAIWEKKFKQEAKHIKQQEDKVKGAAWDPKRGAVGDGDGKPWKTGIRNPFGKSKANEDASTNANMLPLAAARPKPAAPRKRDDVGKLHPSWEARKKAKQAQQNVVFQGKKVVFD